MVQFLRRRVLCTQEGLLSGERYGQTVARVSSDSAVSHHLPRRVAAAIPTVYMHMYMVCYMGFLNVVIHQQAKPSKSVVAAIDWLMVS